MIYFDNAASSPLYPEVLALLQEELTLFANPSSLHRLGFEASKRMERARSQVAAALGAAPEEIRFTSGGTEADNIAVLSAAAKMHRRGKRILTTDSEHPAVAECVKHLEKEGFEVIRLSTRGGELDLNQVEREANENTVLAAVMHTNNETGAVYDLASLSRIVKGKNPRALVFSDCVQGLFHGALCPAELGLDLASVSSHKVHGPKGAGALYVKKGLVLPQINFGGGQEKGLRNGTEPLPAIVAFGEACRLGKERREESVNRMLQVKSTIREGLSDHPKVRFHEAKNPSPHVLSMQVDFARSEVLLHTLSDRGVFVSSGSACSSHSGKSPVLENFGLTKKEADRTVRLSFSGMNTKAEGEEFVKILKEILR